MSLLLRVKDSRDRDAWEEFDRLYRPLLIRYAKYWKYDDARAEDIAQDCLGELTDRMKSFEYDSKLGSFKSWMRTMVNNKIRSNHRKQKEVEATTQHFEQTQATEPDPEKYWEAIWLEEHLRFCMILIKPHVNPTYWEIFNLLMFERWSVKEVCDQLHVRPDRVHTAKFRISQKLKAEMQNLLGDQVQHILE